MCLGLGFTVASRDELARAIDQALAAPVFSVISCTPPRHAYYDRI